MSKAAFDKIAEGLTEALVIARGAPATSEMVEHVASALDKAIRAWLGDTGDWLLSEHLDDDDAKRFLDGLACAAIEAIDAALVSERGAEE